MGNNKPGKAKLRQDYSVDAKAREFLKAYPEFANFEQNSIVNFSDHDAIYDEDKHEKSELIQANLHKLQNKKTRRILEAYYNGDSISIIAERHNRNKKWMYRYIYNAKQVVLELVNKEIRINFSSILKLLGSRIFTHKGVSKTLYLAAIDTGEVKYIMEDGTTLSDELQKYLKGELE